MLYIEHIFIAIAAPFLVICYLAEKGERRHLVSLLTGFITALLAGYINTFFTDLFGLSENVSVQNLTPILEELLKMLPVLFFAEAFAEKRVQILDTAAEIGLGFAVVENCTYLLNYGAEDLLYTVFRGFATGVLHPLCVIISAMGILFIYGRRKFACICFFGFFCAAIMLHGTFNLLLSAGEAAYQFAGSLTPIVLVIIFGICLKIYKRKKGLENFS